MKLFASLKPSRSSLYQVAGLAVFSGSLVLVLLGQLQMAIWLILCGAFAFVVESHCLKLASALPARPANGGERGVQ
jgi:hypothetical protein